VLIGAYHKAEEGLKMAGRGGGITMSRSTTGEIQFFLR
jgi:hypothetical protein